MSNKTDLFAPPTETELNDVFSAPPTEAELKDISSAPPSQEELSMSAVEEEPTTPPEIKKYSTSDILKKGASQGFTYNLGDEAEGFLGRILERVMPNSAYNMNEKLKKEGFSVDDNTTYQAIRDQVRQENEEARVQAETDSDSKIFNPYVAGDVIGNLANPVNYIPGLNVASGAKGASLLSNAKNMAKVGAIQGAITGFGGSNYDLTEGDSKNALGVLKDTAVGTVAGGVAAPVIGTAVNTTLPYVGKKIAQSYDATTSFIGDNLPSLRDAWKLGSEIANGSYDQLRQSTINKYNNVSEKITKFYKDKSNISKEELKTLEKEIQDVTKELLDEQKNLMNIQGRGSQATQEISNLEKELLPKIKQNEKLDEEFLQNQIKQQKQIELNQEKEFKALQEAEDSAYKQRLEETKEFLKKEKKQEEANLKAFDEDFNADATKAKQMASQDFENAMFNNANALDSSLEALQFKLSKEYNKLSDDMGLTIDTYDIVSTASDELLENLRNSNRITMKEEEMLGNLLLESIPQGPKTLNFYKEDITKLRALASAENNRAIKKYLEEIIKRAEKGVEEIVGSIHPSKLKHYKKVNSDYRMVFNFRDKIALDDKPAQTVSFLKAMLANNDNIISAQSQRARQSLLSQLDSPQTKAGKEFKDMVLSTLDEVEKSSADKYLAKYQKSLLKKQKERANIVEKIDLLGNTNPEALTKSRVVVEPPPLQELPAMEKPQAYMDNINEIARIQGLLDDLRLTKTNNIDEEIAKKGQILNLEEKKLNAENVLKEYLEKKKTLKESNVVEDMIGSSEKSQRSRARSAVARSGDDKINKTYLEDKEILDFAKKENPELSGELEDVSSKLNIFNLDDAPLSGPLSDRAILARTAPKLLYNTSRFVSRAVDLPPVKLISKFGGQTSAIGKVLYEASKRGDAAYKATLYTLQQQSKEFRDELKNIESEENEGN